MDGEDAEGRAGGGREPDRFASKVNFTRSNAARRSSLDSVVEVVASETGVGKKGDDLLVAEVGEIGVLGKG